MALKKIVAVGAKHCELIDLDVELKEERIFPTADFLQTQGNTYWVKSCACSAAIACNMAGVPCHWALNSPGNDRF